MSLKKKKMQDARKLQKLTKYQDQKKYTPISGLENLESVAGAIDPSSVDSKNSPSRLLAADTTPDHTPLKNGDKKVQQRNLMLKKIEEALRKSFERKQDQILSNL